MKEAQSLYITKYGVDITSIVSLPSLAIKIFRLNFLNVDIPIITGSDDMFLRLSYYGVATDIYKAYAKKAYYYDVRYLYPKAMLNLMPLNIIERIINPYLETFNLNDLFGFINLEIECPSSVINPVLPSKLNGRTIFPRGRIKGVYFLF